MQSIGNWDRLAPDDGVVSGRLLDCGEALLTANNSPSEPSESGVWWPDRLIRRWVLLVIGGVVGGLFALALSTTRPPQYEAEAVLQIGVDYPRVVELDELPENRVLDRAAALIASDTTIALTTDRLQARYGQDPAWSSAAELRSHTRIDRETSAWGLVGIAETPEAAARIADAWLEVTQAELDQAMDHAWEALRLQSAAIILACSELSQGDSTDFFWQCIATGPNLDPARTAALRREIELSRGVSPILSYEPVRRAVPASSPVVWARAPLIVGGAVAGIILGGFLAVVLPSTRKASTSP
jgi:hypothetical protein